MFALLINISLPDGTKRGYEDNPEKKKAANQETFISGCANVSLTMKHLLGDFKCPTCTKLLQKFPDECENLPLAFGSL